MSFFRPLAGTSTTFLRDWMARARLYAEARRALDIKEADAIDEAGLMALFVEAAELNAETAKAKKK